jgi:hypothetical protein
MCYSSLTHPRFYLYLDPLSLLFSLLSRISLKLGRFNYLFLLKHYDFMSHDMLHHLELIYSLKCCTCLNLFEFGIGNPSEKK